jgi:hypothetical protein
MSRDKEERVEKNEAYPLRYVEFFSTLSDAVGIGFVRSSKAVFAWLLLFAFFFAINAAQIYASVELDRKYSLDSVGFLKAWDNVDGLFADYVTDAYKAYFAGQSRFLSRDISRANSLLARSKIPYSKLIEDRKILGQLSRATKSATLIRTKIYKEGNQYRFIIDWLHAPQMDLLSTVEFTLEQPEGRKSFGVEEIRNILAQGLDQLILKVPFRAHVTGRDQQAVTINIGSNTSLKAGDKVVVGTLEEVKLHPLLHSVVDWRSSETGRMEVETIDGGMAFCRVLQEEPGRKIARYQKVVQILPKPLDTSVEPDAQSKEQASARDAPPEFGWASAGLWLGQLSRQYSATASGGTASGKNGSGIFYGAKADVQVWLFRTLFAELGLGYATSSYTQKDLATGTASSSVTVSTSMSQFGLGYLHYLTPNMFGPKGWAKVAYQGLSYTMPDSDDEFTGPTSFGGLALAVGADLPLWNVYGALLSFDYGVMQTAAAEGVTGTPSGVTNMGFYLGGYYRLAPKMTVRTGIELLMSGADMGSGASLTHSAVSIGPSLLYYF